ncbi:hypothetical protein RclHR1_02790008 [Rhizophagus clarus]|uniref:Kinase-like domain-containing protein n=1 Tax=Rhizophagus clarus TaxID=94130 RepID=A0A2Z6R3J2_9GLOM|nr:hypothetical protein RclHR1_02790008 [Rhizophagus clarus]GES73327.1 kinase-like domain-containing protein [Rhizophagus clarus]
MDQLNDTTLSQLTETTLKPKGKRKTYKKCNECNKRRKPSDENQQICHICYNMKKIFNSSSGNKIIDDFIRDTQTNLVKGGTKLEFVPYDQFENIEFIAEGGFSKIYKATWIDGPISQVMWYRPKLDNIIRQPNFTVVLKKLNNSKNITSKELNELKIYYKYYTKWENEIKKIDIGSPFPNYDRLNCISDYYGITQDSNTQDFIIIMPYYGLGDLRHYISNDFYNIKWVEKLDILEKIVIGLINIHRFDIVHRDLHSGNIFFDKFKYNNTCIGDLGISKSAIESANNNENYGIIPYMPPEIFRRQKYIKASDVYSLGMIMWELMTGRRPFWDRNHDTELIIDICDGLRPPIVTDAPEGYIDLMRECWHSDPDERPSAFDINDRVCAMSKKEFSDSENENPTEIIKSSDIGPVTANNPGAIYKSRSLSGMINSAMSLVSSRSQSINFEKVKRKFDDNSIEANNDYGQSRKRKQNKDNDYLTTEEFELDIDISSNNDCNFTEEIELDIDINSNNNEYVTKENEFDINF